MNIREGYLGICVELVRFYFKYRRQTSKCQGLLQAMLLQAT